MATNKEAKVKFTAETSEFSKGISNINKSLGNLKSDLKLVNTEIKANGANFDNLSDKQKTLKNIVDDLSDKLELQGNKLEAAKRLFGENSDEVNKLYRGYNNIQGELVKFTRELKDTENALEKMGDEAEEASRDVDKLENEMDDVEGSGGGLKGVLEGLKGGFDLGATGAVTLGTALGNLATGAITMCVDALKDFCGYLWDLPEATEEFRVNMAKLEGATEQYGYNVDLTKEKIKEMYGYFADEQVATNAITNLQGLKLTQEDLNGLLDAGVAVWSAYGDSIPIESLTESFNETAQVGKVTGALADALNWAGISEDDFNKKLETCKTTQERAKLITDTMNDAYGESKTKFDENTESIRLNREQQYELLETESKLAEIIEPLKTKFEDFKENALENMIPIIEQVVEWFEKFCDWCGQLKDDFDELRNTEMGQFFETLLKILGAVVWETIRQTFDRIKLVIEGLVEAFKILAEIFEPVFEKINDFIENVKSDFDAFVKGFKEGLEGVEKVVGPVKDAFDDLCEAVGDIVEVIGDAIFSGVADDMEDTEGKAETLGETLGGMVLDAIKKVSAAFIVTSGVIQGLIAVIKPFIQLLDGDVKGAMESFKEIPGKLEEICENTTEQLNKLAEDASEEAEDVAEGINEGFDNIDDELPVDNLARSMKKGMSETKTETEKGLSDVEKKLTGFNPKWKVSKPDTKDAKQEGNVLTKELENGLKGWSPIWKVSKPDTKDATSAVTGSNGITKELEKGLKGWSPIWKVSKPDTKDATNTVTGSSGLTNSLSKSLGGWTANWKISNPDTKAAVNHVKTSYSSQTFDTNVKGSIKSTEDKLPSRPNIASVSDMKSSKQSFGKPTIDSLSNMNSVKQSFSRPTVASLSNMTSWKNSLGTPSITSKSNMTSWSKTFNTPSITSAAKMTSWTKTFGTPTISIIGKITSWIGAKFNADGAVYQYHARGGIMTSPTVFHIGGEAGAEAILPLDGFYNYLDSKLDTIAGGSTSVVNINLENVQIKDDRSIEDLADQLAFLIQRKSRF